MMNLPIPHSRRLPPRRGRPPAAAPAGLLLAAALLLAAGPAAGQEVSNPNLYGKTLKASKAALDQYGADDDLRALERGTDVGYRLAVMSDFRDFPFSFYLIDMPEPNAFALPGGQIFVTRGMLGLGLTDDMLACLLGHEIAHVTERHGLRMQRRATWLNVLSQAAVLGVLIGVDDRPENPRDPYGIDYSPSRKASLVQGTAAAGLAITELLLRDYSRDFESEADVEGQRLAAAAGFDPGGAHQLWALMNQRIPQEKSYGYWRTHPFSDARQRAAEVRAAELKIQQGRPAEDYRAKTQQVILAYGASQNKDPELGDFIELSALTAWPQGPRAEKLRAEKLAHRREIVLGAAELERDYGELIRAYRVELEEVRRRTPESAFIATLERQLEELRRESEALYPKALEVWKEGIYQTPFLETFLSNYPTSEVAPQVALALGNAYSRLGRRTDGVDLYLRAAEAGPGSEAAAQALAGLRNLTPVLDELAALQHLHDDLEDPQLSELAAERLGEIAPTYKEISNGAEYLRRYPEGEHAAAVRERLEVLARNLYGEVVTYQGIGDHVNALERIQQILTYAPDSQAAESLRDRAVVDS